MKRRFLPFLLIGAILASSAPAYADPLTLPETPALQPGEQPVGPVISPLKQNQKAPFTGLLLSPESVAKIIVELNSQTAQTQIEVKRATETQKAIDQRIIDDLNSTVKYLKTTNDIQVKSRDEAIAQLTKKLAEEEKNRPNLPMWVGLGAAGGVVLTVVTVFAVSSAMK